MKLFVLLAPLVVVAQSFLASQTFAQQQNQQPCKPGQSQKDCKSLPPNAYGDPTKCKKDCEEEKKKCLTDVIPGNSTNDQMADCAFYYASCLQICDGKKVNTDELCKRLADGIAMQEKLLAREDPSHTVTVERLKFSIADKKLAYAKYCTKK